jgi:eukaryotic-like serine/threonine-protein kinase
MMPDMPEDLTGRTLSHYRIIQQIGSGGMGEVYLAEDTKLERTVALKVLPPEVASDQERMRRFVREAKAASALDHPNIVHVYEINESEGINYIAMQFVGGQMLSKAINGRPLDVETFLSIATQIVDALAEAHSRGIIHRDLKPQNMMISDKGHVKLLDFGLARIEQPIMKDRDSQQATMSKTQSGIVLGTIAYMSPEQALGQRVDQRTDIFSLGVVLYEMSTGTHPFVGTSTTETIDKIIHAQPDSISRLNYNFPQELERIIRKCLEKDSGRRYQSAAEINIDLKNFQRDLNSEESKTNKSAPSSDKVKSPEKPERKYWIPVAAVALAILIAGIIFYRSHQTSGRPIQALAVLPFKNINLDPKTEYLSDGITDSIINNVSLIRQIKVMARGTVFTYKARDVDPREVGKELGVDGVVTGKLLQEGNSLVVTVDLVDARDGRLIWGEQYDRKLADILSLQSEISREISDKLRIKLTTKEADLVSKQYTENTEAFQLYLQGQFFLVQRTLEGTQRAMGFFYRAIEKDPSYALAYDGVANCYSYLGITGALLGGLPPKEVMPKAKEAALKAIQLDNTLAQPHATLGHIHFNYDYDWVGSENEMRKALELNPNYPATYLLMALSLTSLGRTEEANSFIEKFRTLDPGYFPGTLIGIGIQQYWARRFDSAVEQFERITKMAPNFPSPYFWLGCLYLEKKQGPKAIEEFQKAVDLSNRAPVALTGLGIGLARNGRTQEGNRVLEELLDRSKKQYVPEFWMACLFGALGRKDEAFAWFDKAYQERANGLPLIKVLPLVDNLRSDPRFAALLKRMNLQN